MYGLVNRALEDMISEVHGPETWEHIKGKAGVDVEMFISTEGYPDEVTSAALEICGKRFKKKLTAAAISPKNPTVINPSKIFSDSE